jgi:ABC-type lipoprotein export system ATPase subunit
MLQIKNLSKSYPSASGLVDHKVLDNLTLEVTRGETIAVTGPSGSGKTTLMNIIGTLDVPDSGEVIFENLDLKNLTEKTRPEFRNKKIGLIFQLHHLLPQCTLWENVLIPAIPQKNGGNGTLKRAEELLKRTGIWDQRFQKPAELSGGECQRAAVVRALINEPSLILADEPTGALDQDNARNLVDLLLELNSELGTTLIMVTHAPELAKKMGKTYRLSKGKLV